MASRVRLAANAAKRNRYLPNDIITSLSQESRWQHSLVLLRTQCIAYLMVTEQSTRVCCEEAAAPPQLVIFGGGTATNELVPVLHSWNRRVSHVMPVTDNGGSTAEILRVLRGPAIGDIRSRLVNLSKFHLRHSDRESYQVHPSEKQVVRLLEYRLPTEAESALAEWSMLLDGRHSLYKGITTDYKSVIQSFLLKFHSEILRNAVSVNAGISVNKGFDIEANFHSFDFRRASIGNCFFTGVRLHFGSLPAAILMWTRIAQIPPETRVLPVMNLSFFVTIGVELENGDHIIGQSEISHPEVPGENLKESGKVPLPAPVRRLFFVNEHGQELKSHSLPANADVLDAIESADCVVYSVGSLLTSVLPSLLLPAIGARIRGAAVPKVLLLNSEHDRETTCTSPQGMEVMTGKDMVEALCRACQGFERVEAESWRCCVTDVVVAQGSPFLSSGSAEARSLEKLGIRLHWVPCKPGCPGWLDFSGVVKALADIAATQSGKEVPFRPADVR
ncbi:unnamed protein product [Effrenium voratum]|uniref:Gluconeogenesis factor n=1 Tax=Effrenium voratum TaxID=2562239 RepID=A0AA36IV52_9DINO|nr:unnamed protein product [Effrenium voratum]